MFMIVDSIVKTRLMMIYFNWISSINKLTLLGQHKIRENTTLREGNKIFVGIFFSYTRMISKKKVDHVYINTFSEINFTLFGQYRFQNSNSFWKCTKTNMYNLLSRESIFLLLRQVFQVTRSNITFGLSLFEWYLLHSTISIPIIP